MRCRPGKIASASQRDFSKPAGWYLLQTLNESGLAASEIALLWRCISCSSRLRDEAAALVASALESSASVGDGEVEPLLELWPGDAEAVDDWLWAAIMAFMVAGDNGPVPTKPVVAVELAEAELLPGSWNGFWPPVALVEDEPDDDEVSELMALSADAAAPSANIMGRTPAVAAAGGV
jgi:hypothetical protein